MSSRGEWVRNMLKTHAEIFVTAQTFIGCGETMSSRLMKKRSLTVSLGSITVAAKRLRNGITCWQKALSLRAVICLGAVEDFKLVSIKLHIIFHRPCY